MSRAQQGPVAVAGASGHAGGELLRYLAQHPTFDLLAACAAGRAGEPLAQVHPQFAGTSWAQMVLDETTPDVLNQADLVFLALPHGESAAIVQALDADVRVVDVGADLRLTSADAWVTYYGGDHAGSWTYGLPELPGKRDEIASSTRAANPSCYPTAVALALAPLAKALDKTIAALTEEIATLRAIVTALFDTVRRHEPQLRRLTQG